MRNRMEYKIVPGLWYLPLDAIRMHMVNSYGIELLRFGTGQRQVLFVAGTGFGLRVLLIKPDYAFSYDFGYVFPYDLFDFADGVLKGVPVRTPLHFGLEEGHVFEVHLDMDPFVRFSIFPEGFPTQRIFSLFVVPADVETLRNVLIALHYLLSKPFGPYVRAPQPR